MSRKCSEQFGSVRDYGPNSTTDSLVGSTGPTLRHVSSSGMCSSRGNDGNAIMQCGVNRRKAHHVSYSPAPMPIDSSTGYALTNGGSGATNYSSRATAASPHNDSVCKRHLSHTSSMPVSYAAAAAQRSGGPAARTFSTIKHVTHSSCANAASGQGPPNAASNNGASSACCNNVRQNCAANNTCNGQSCCSKNNYVYGDTQAQTHGHTMDCSQTLQTLRAQRSSTSQHQPPQRPVYASSQTQQQQQQQHHHNQNMTVRYSQQPNASYPSAPSGGTYYGSIGGEDLAGRSDQHNYHSSSTQSNLSRGGGGGGGGGDHSTPHQHYQPIQQQQQRQSYPHRETPQQSFLTGQQQQQQPPTHLQQAGTGGASYPTNYVTEANTQYDGQPVSSGTYTTSSLDATNDYNHHHNHHTSQQQPQSYGQTTGYVDGMHDPNRGYADGSQGMPDAFSGQASQASQASRTQASSSNPIQHHSASPTGGTHFGSAGLAASSPSVQPASAAPLASPALLAGPPAPPPPPPPLAATGVVAAAPVAAPTGLAYAASAGLPIMPRRRVIQNAPYSGSSVESALALGIVSASEGNSRFVGREGPGPLFGDYYVVGGGQKQYLEIGNAIQWEQGYVNNMGIDMSNRTDIIINCGGPYMWTIVQLNMSINSEFPAQWGIQFGCPDGSDGNENIPAVRVIGSNTTSATGSLILRVRSQTVFRIILVNCQDSQGTSLAKQVGGSAEARVASFTIVTLCPITLELPTETIF